jgi:hypothetical protein
MGQALSLIVSFDENSVTNMNLDILVYARILFIGWLMVANVLAYRIVVFITIVEEVMEHAANYRTIYS